LVGWLVRLVVYGVQMKGVLPWLVGWLDWS
jgi:hypothetical protein